MARAAAAGAYQNVCINLGGLTDASRKGALLKRADDAWSKARAAHAAAEEETLVRLRAKA
jgi:hypothetical protein